MPKINFENFVLTSIIPVFFYLPCMSNKKNFRNKKYILNYNNNLIELLFKIFEHYFRFTERLSSYFIFQDTDKSDNFSKRRIR